MKQLLRAVAIFTLVLTYCLEAGSVYSYTNQNNVTFQDKGSVVSAVSLNLLGSATSSENLFNVFNVETSVSIKNLFKSYALKVKKEQQIFTNHFSQYSFSVKNFQTLFRKTNLIFPFNYFW